MGVKEFSPSVRVGVRRHPFVGPRIGSIRPCPVSGAGRASHRCGRILVGARDSIQAVVGVALHPGLAATRDRLAQQVAVVVRGPVVEPKRR